MNINKNKTTKDYKKRKKIGQFFTESKLVNEIIDKFKLNFDNKIIIEPSCGDGSFIKGIISSKAKYKKIFGIDIDKKALNASEFSENDRVILKHTSFLNYNIKEKIDLIIGNPPFNLPDERYIDTTEAFVSTGIDVLSDNGELILIVPNTVLRIQKYQKLREKILSETKIISIMNTSNYEFLGADIETIAIYLKKEKVKKQTYEYINGDEIKNISLIINERKTIMLDNIKIYNDLNKKLNGKKLSGIFDINRGHFSGNGLRGRNVDFYNDFIDMHNGNDLFIAVQNIAYRIVANVVRGNIKEVNDTITILKPKIAMSIDKLKYIANFLNSSITYYNLHINCLNNCRLTVHIDKYYIADIKVPMDFDSDSLSIVKNLKRHVKTKELSKIRNEYFYKKYNLDKISIEEIEKYWKAPKFKIKEEMK